jgi:glycerol uptake facilitator-like aquaporin
MNFNRRLVAEFLGTAGLLVVLVGSGIMAESLAGGQAALALLINSLATGAGLFALIQVFGPVSGAHFNPAITFLEWLNKRFTAPESFAYVFAQVLGALIGVLVVHIMFGQDLLQLSMHNRGESRLIFSEFIATFGLLLVVALSGKRSVEATPASVALYITSAYWCTSSTSFANPAATVARSFTDTFTGIHWTSAPGFILAQLVGAGVAFVVSKKFK